MEKHGKDTCCGKCEGNCNNSDKINGGVRMTKSIRNATIEEQGDFLRKLKTEDITKFAEGVYLLRETEILVIKSRKYTNINDACDITINELNENISDSSGKFNTEFYSNKSFMVID